MSRIRLIFVPFLVVVLLFGLAFIPFLLDAKRTQVTDGITTSAAKIDWLSLGLTRYNRHELNNHSKPFIVESIHIEKLTGTHTSYNFDDDKLSEIWIWGWGDHQVDAKIDETLPSFKKHSEEAEELLTMTRKRFADTIGKPGVDDGHNKRVTVTIPIEIK